MITLVILFIISANFLVIGFHAIKDIFEEVYDRLSRTQSQKDKFSQSEKVYFALGTAIAIIGAVLYYYVCASTIKNIVAVRHPVEEPIPFGISAIITSIFFAGGLFNVMCTFELDTDRKKRIVQILFIALVVLLVAYLVLKAAMILP